MSELPTFGDCITNATRLLHAAEMESNLVLMERLTNLAEQWLYMANQVSEVEA